MPSPSGILTDSSIFAFGDGGGMPPPYNDVSDIYTHFPIPHIKNSTCFSVKCCYNVDISFSLTEVSHADRH